MLEDLSFGVIEASEMSLSEIDVSVVSFVSLGESLLNPW